MTDPYDDEPDAEVQPVRLWLTRADKSFAVVETDARAMSDRSVVRCRGVLFAYAGSEQRPVPGGAGEKAWYRLYREVDVIDVGTMTVSEQKFP